MLPSQTLIQNRLKQFVENPPDHSEQQYADQLNPLNLVSSAGISNRQPGQTMYHSVSTMYQLYHVCRSRVFEIEYEITRASLTLCTCQMQCQTAFPKWLRAIQWTGCLE